MSAAEVEVGIEERLAAWQRRGDPQCLWPHVRVEDRLQAHERIAGVAKQILARDRGVPHLRADGPAEVEATGIAAYVSGMGPLLGYWIQTGRLGASAPVSALLSTHLDHGRGRAHKLDTELARVLEACATRGVDAIVLKGAHIGHEYFDEPGLRPASDIDLLVDPKFAPAVHSALHDAGFYESRRTTYPERSEWLRRAAPQKLRTLRLDHEDNPWSVDLHTRIERNYFRGLRAGFGNVPFQHTTEWRLRGQRALILNQPVLAAFMALNASFGIDELRLLKIVELVFVIRKDVALGKLDMHALAELIARTGTARFVYPAFELAERLAPGTLPASLRATIEAAATPRMRRVVNEAEQRGMHLPRRSLGEKLMWARGPLELGRNLLDMLRPPDDGLSFDEVLRSYGRRLRRALGGQVAYRL